MTPRGCPWPIRALASDERAHCLLVAARAHLAVREDLVARDPGEGFLEGLLGIGLEDEALARPPARGVHLRAEALGEFLLVVMRVAVGPQVDVALRAAERAEIAAHILGIGLAG